MSNMSTKKHNALGDTKQNNNLYFVNNDTFAVIGLVLIAIFSLLFKLETIASTAIGAIGGYIGSKNSNNT